MTCQLVARFPQCWRLAAPQVTTRTTRVQNALAYLTHPAGPALPYPRGSLDLERCARLVGQYPLAPIAFACDAAARRILRRSAPLSLWPLRCPRRIHPPLTFDKQRAGFCTDRRAPWHRGPYRVLAAGRWDALPRSF